MLGEEAARPVPRSDGTTDLYVAPDSFHDIFCQDVPAPQAVPSWFLIGEEDHIIPAALQHYMAKRAHAHRTLEIPEAAALPVAS
jgi:pimeloyl-ACP methyl ester carboxylesterase